MTFRTTLFAGLLWMLMLVGCASDGLRDVRQGTAKMVTTTDQLAPPDSTSSTGAYTGVSD